MVRVTSETHVDYMQVVHFEVREVKMSHPYPQLADGNVLKYRLAHTEV